MPRIKRNVCLIETISRSDEWDDFLRREAAGRFAGPSLKMNTRVALVE